MPLGLIKLSRLAFPDIFVIGFLLIILLLVKQTTTKNGPKGWPYFFIIGRSLLMVFLALLSNKTKQRKDTCTSVL